MKRLTIDTATRDHMVYIPLAGWSEGVWILLDELDTSPLDLRARMLLDEFESEDKS